MDQPMRRFELEVDGAKVVVVESGQGEPCLLLHGYPQSHRCWRRVAPVLARTHRVIAVDWLGWGDSERSLQLVPRFEDEVERLARLLDALELEQVNLIAHDYGGLLALGLATHHPERIARLALINTRAHRTFSLPWYLLFNVMILAAMLPGGQALFARMPWYWSHRIMMRRYVANGSFSQEELEGYLGWLRALDGRRWLAHFYRHFRVKARAEFEATARGLNLPVAVIWGARDPYFPVSIGEELVGLIPGAAWTRIDDGDHYIVEEKPQEVCGALLALLARPLP